MSRSHADGKSEHLSINGMGSRLPVDAALACALLAALGCDSCVVRSLHGTPPGLDDLKNVSIIKDSVSDARGKQELMQLAVTPAEYDDMGKLLG